MPTEIIQIALDQVLLNNPNPRGFIDPVAVEALSASMATEGQKTEIKVRLLDNNQYRVVGGDHRVLAARKLGWTTIQAQVLAITPDQAYLEGYLDNQSKPMGWFADYMAIEVLWKQTDGKKGSQKPIAARLMKSEAVVSLALKLMPLLNAASREAILYLVKNRGDEPVTQKAILALTALSTGTGSPMSPIGDEPAQPNLGSRLVASTQVQDRVEATLKVLLDRKMNEKQAKNLVAWVKAGNPADTFGVSAQPTPQPARAPKASTPHTVPTSAEGSTSPAPPAISPSTPENSVPAVKGSPTALFSADSHLESPNGDKAAQPKHGAQPETAPQTQVFWEWVAGISFIGQIKSKLKKGEPLSGGEKFLVGSWRLMKIIGWGFKHGFKLLREAVKIGWKLLKKADKFVEKLLGKKISNRVRWAMAILFIWGLWVEYHHNPLHQLKVLVSKTLSSAWASSPVEPSRPAPDRGAPGSSTVAGSPTGGALAPSPNGETSPVTTQSTPLVTLVPAKPKVSSPQPTPGASTTSADDSASATVVQPTPTVHKTDIAGDVLKAAPAGVDVAKKLFGL